MSTYKTDANNKGNNKKMTKDEASPGSIRDQTDALKSASNQSPTQLSIGPRSPPHLQYVVQHVQHVIVPGYGVNSPLPQCTSSSPENSRASSANDSNFQTTLHNLKTIECNWKKLDPSRVM
ncbi:hypothetical protein DPMN_012146 [Dreissena polymorpha]|uniref:Uncharacterized protein n=1 Tax=Dreissena polymorpha TaxID=45954 RepID=A0A9D4S2G9_DREPO|nr:hypothetical protein DPMN_012146 [Dreissena polymorpha]